MRYLETLSIETVQAEFESFAKKKTIQINTEDAIGLKLAEDLYSTTDTPNFYKSTVDGYAIHYTDSTGASETAPTILTKIPSYSIGEENKGELNRGECQYVVTGAMIPNHCSGVVKVEDCEEFGNRVFIKTPIGKLSNIIIPGEECKRGDSLLLKDSKLTGRDIALLLSLGIQELSVYKPLTCVVISTGNELVHYTKERSLGQIYDVNTSLISQELENMGHTVIDTLVIPDDYELYKKTLQNYDVDLYVTSGGSSKGKEDFTVDVFEELTHNVICHGVHIKPGKPTILARSDNALYLGLPGNPVSAFMVLHQLLHTAPKTIQLPISENVHSDYGKATLVLVRIQGAYVEPIYYRSSYLNSLALADGYFVIGERVEGVYKDNRVEVITFA